MFNRSVFNRNFECFCSLAQNDPKKSSSQKSLLVRSKSQRSEPPEEATTVTKSWAVPRSRSAGAPFAAFGESMMVLLPIHKILYTSVYCKDVYGTII